MTKRSIPVLSKVPYLWGERLYNPSPTHSALNLTLLCRLDLSSNFACVAVSVRSIKWAWPITITMLKIAMPANII